MDEFEKLGIDDPEGEPDYPTPTFRMQPCCLAGVGYGAGGVMRWARRAFRRTIRGC